MESSEWSLGLVVMEESRLLFLKVESENSVAGFMLSMEEAKRLAEALKELADIGRVDDTCLREVDSCCVRGGRSRWA